jgi:hypothetical protein
MASNDRRIARTDANAHIKHEAGTAASVRRGDSLSRLELAELFQDGGFRNRKLGTAWRSELPIQSVLRQRENKGPLVSDRQSIAEL